MRDFLDFAVMMLAWLMLMLACGCTTAGVSIPGVANIMQPKDVTIGSPGIEYRNPDGTTILVQNYTSNANVAAMQAQAALLQGIVAQAVSAAVSAAIPGALPAVTTAAPVVTTPTAVLRAVETTTIIPAATGGGD